MLFLVTVEVDFVLLPPEAMTFIPEGSTSVINCTADSNQSPAWAIQLPGQNFQLQFPIEASKMSLNNRGFYELPELDLGERIIIRLLLNNTMSNNGTVVGCIDAGLGVAIAQTAVNVYGKPMLVSNTKLARLPVQQTFST